MENTNILRGQKKKNMGKLLMLLWCTSVLGDVIQDRYNKTSGPVPKTFSGRISSDPTNYTTELISNNHTSNYITGIVSTKIIPLSYLVAIFIGVPTNVFVLVSLIHKSRNLSSAFLYLSLAASDLLLLVSLIFKVHYHLNGNNWVFGELACKVVTACFYGNVYCSIHAHMWISVLRYLAVVHPFFYRGMCKRSCAAWAGLTAWVVFAAAALPEFLTRQSYYVANLGVTTCHDVLPYEKDEYAFFILYRLCLIGVGFVLPFAVSTFAYGSIVRQLSRSSCDWGHYIKASTLVFGIFLLCFTPSNAVHFIHYVRLYTSQQDNFYMLFSVAVSLSCFHSCLDPFLSYIISKTTASEVDLIFISSTTSTTV